VTIRSAPGFSGAHAPRLAALTLLLAGGLHAPWATAQGDLKIINGIYTCVDAHGRRITSDRPIRECLDREQAELNNDGSVRRKLPPSLTADERAAADEAARRKAAVESTRNDAARRDRNLMARYKDETAHHKARESGLELARRLVKSSQLRLVDLEHERKALQDEAEFYKGKDLPPRLKAQFDANTVTTEAQRSLVATHQAELNRMTAFYDEELARLRKLWAGATPGSMGNLGSAEAAASTTPGR
jgi:hypothetical protein